MGVGYVPTGTIRQECQGDDVPRREHRGTRTDLSYLEPDLSRLDRRQIGSLGETIAGRFLQDRGATVIDRNVRVGRGEIDLLVRLGGRRIAVEVKTTIAGSSGDAIYHFDRSKQRQVRNLGRQRGATRVDYVGIELGATGAIVRWLPNVC